MNCLNYKIWKENNNHMKKRNFSERMQLSIVLMMAMASAFNFIAGVGTACVAFGMQNLGESYKPILPFQGTYQTITIVTILIGLIGLYITYAFMKGKKFAYIFALITLVIGFIFGVIHVYLSTTHLGSGVPANVRVYLDAIVIIFLLVIRYPNIWNRIDLTKPMLKNKKKAKNTVGSAFIIVGISLLCSPLYVSSSHIIGGYNYIESILPVLYFVSIMIVVFGIMILIKDKVLEYLDREILFPEKKKINYK